MTAHTYFFAFGIVLLAILITYFILRDLNQGKKLGDIFTYLIFCIHRRGVKSIFRYKFYAIFHPNSIYRFNDWSSYSSHFYNASSP
ncbi:isoprenylcysteine carboxyl methyltransferase (ICMT) family protein YpbQ [Bacillus pakistanensis]|uniref:Isoprenylcysteine carboxyl methyltransferase (ICMT) family protein YpbQ n=1 Tax=Rossellomorea pakistanensis TaxID=992288 RepID=A0ABS2NBE0_9BACI|nr:isoprenylcysteine carboxyl methyltransferase (ICMT) family protein YpbQ [Bacillus pakistanensis]